ncbi:TonB-dependent receptor [Hahella sp. HN01]|uniref:TonB-dependent receptor n=1 Tax=Hahella sp. HN01 TaxID=2847262 RepID=UPI001C1EA345|nr:TonB-dependent receptor [Hahella sp. HN01]MBU6951326.1 TonB-dependent receptor [Hahella sp. HN01]
MRLNRAIGAVASLALPLGAAAEEATVLQAVEVVGERPALVTEPTALQTEVMAEKLENINSPEVSDALKYEPNLIVRKRYIGDRNATLSFRETHTTQTARAVVMGDGVMLSNFLGSSFNFAPRWSLMQPEEIEWIEVLYGPYSAEYSGNAMGGAVIMHGRMPEQREAQVSAGAFLQDFSAYGTDETYFGYKTHASFGDRQGPWSYFLATDWLQNEGHPQSFGIASGAGGAPVGNPVEGAHDYPAGGYLYNSAGRSDIGESVSKIKLGYDINERLQARLTLAYLDRNEDSLNPETYLRDAAGQPVYNGDVDIDGASYKVSSQRLGESEAKDLIYGAELEGALGDGWEIKSAVSLYDVLEQKQRRSGTNYEDAQANGAGTLTEDQGTGWETADVKFGHRHDGGWLGDRVLFGYHFDRYRLDQANYNTTHWRSDDIASLSGDTEGTTRTHALFVENEWTLAPAWGMTLGARQEWWRAYDGKLARDFGPDRVSAAYPERSESDLSPKASFSYRPNADWSATLSLALAYRYPTVGELYQGSIDNTGAFNASFDPDLKKEKSFAKNLTVKRSFDSASVTVSLWENDVDDAIYRQTNVLTGVTNYQNVDRVRSRGVELVTGFQNVLTPGLDLDFNLSFTDAEILKNSGAPESEGKQFPRVPKWRANALAGYQATEQLRLGGGVRYASDPYDSLDNSDGDRSGFGYTDSFLVFDARAAYALDEHFSVAGGVDNLTDERYYVYHPYPGRTYYAEVKWKY